MIPTPGVARTLEELEHVQTWWDRFQVSRIDAGREFYSTFVRMSPHVLRPHVALLGDPVAPIGMLVARIERARRTVSVGYRVVYGPEVRQLTVVHGGLVTDGTDDAARLALREIRELLAAHEADVALLPAVWTRSAIHAQAERVGWLVRGHGQQCTVHRRLVLPARFDDFLASLQNRKRIATYRRRLERDFAGRLDVRVYDRPADLDVIVRDLTQVSRRTYQHGLGVAFADSELRRELTREGLRNGWFRTWVMYVDNEPVSFWPGDVCARSFFTGTPGYDPAFASYRVGMLLLLRVIEDLCADPGVDAVDFNFGDADYKRRFSNESWEEQDIVLFAPTLRATRINLTCSGLLAGTQATKRVAASIGLDRTVKRWWRGRLASRDARS